MRRIRILFSFISAMMYTREDFVAYRRICDVGSLLLRCYYLAIAKLTWEFIDHLACGSHCAEKSWTPWFAL